MTSTTKLRLSVAAIFLCIGLTASGQSKSNERYYKESAEIRETVFNWDKPEFKVRTVPDEFNKASKVVVAHHTELTADSKSKLVYYGLGFGGKKELSIMEIVREMVKVNDKVAVDYYSELSFSLFEKKSNLYKKDNSTTYVGVRIIKPDGKIREVNADEMVLTKDASKEKVAKLAIPDLQPGDIVDYFIATDLLMTNDFTTREYSVILFDEAPTMHHSFHGQLGKKFAVDYRSYNGAPDVKVTRNSDDDIVIDVTKKNMPAFETTLWVAPAVQLPFIRMNISLGTRKGRYGYAKAGEINKNKSADEVLTDKARTFGYEYYVSQAGGGLEQDEVVKLSKKRAKAAGTDFSDMRDEERAAFVYYNLRFSKILNFDIDAMERSIRSGEFTFNGLSSYLFNLMRKAQVRTGVLVSSTRTGFRMNEVMEEDDLRSTTFVGDQKKFITIRSIYDVPFETPQDIEGMGSTKTFGITPRALKAVGSGGDYANNTEQSPGFKVPMSDPSANAHIDKLKISLIPGQNTVAVKRNTTIRGHYKRDTQRALILYEDFYESERKLLGEEMSLLEKLEDSKRGRKYVEEVKNAFAEARKKQKDAFLEEAKGWFEQEITNLKDYKVESMGVRHTAPDLVYSSSFDMDGLVKKAGNNFIFEVGKIQASPLTIKPEQRKRDMDIFMSFPRSIEFQVEVKVPEGYTVEGLEAINKNVVNDAGAFVASATLTGDMVRIVMSRKYNHAYEPSANWDKLLAFIDAGSEWSNSKILFRKK
ncbi:MAG: DUF3857 domain-containing protein [Chitinophagaceae bacterium]|nr:MAG: DUF3857 domain-containing protein [Chitinophagaceae bacterium]